MSDEATISEVRRWGGGAFDYAVDDGEIAVGDEVKWVEYEEFE